MSPKKETIHRIETCYFRRKEHEEYEIGLLLNEGDLGILDKFGKLVDDCWTWERDSTFAMDIDLTMIENRTKTCVRCDGGGDIRNPDISPTSMDDLVTCPDCGGSGEVPR